MQTVEMKNIILKGIIYLIISDYEFIVPNLKVYQYVTRTNNKIKCIKIIILLISNKKPK